RTVEALARFDELTAERVPRRPVQRRVQPNTAAVTGTRLDAAGARRDGGAFAARLAAAGGGGDPTAGATYWPPGALASYRALMGARDPKFHCEPLATLGDCLALCGLSVSASGTGGRTVDVGPYEKEEVDLLEVDAEGRYRSSEVFASDHLGHAVVRLYE